jgi:hypothetical protein
MKTLLFNNYVLQFSLKITLYVWLVAIDGA